MQVLSHIPFKIYTEIFSKIFCKYSQLGKTALFIKTSLTWYTQYPVDFPFRLCMLILLCWKLAISFSFGKRIENSWVLWDILPPVTWQAWVYTKSINFRNLSQRDRPGIWKTSWSQKHFLHLFNPSDKNKQRKKILTGSSFFRVFSSSIFWILKCLELVWRSGSCYATEFISECERLEPQVWYLSGSQSAYFWQHGNLDMEIEF